MKKTIIRKARKSDFEDIFKLIVELAHFEKLTPPSKTAKKRLFLDSFGAKRKNNILIAQIDNEITGYAFYFYPLDSDPLRLSFLISCRHRPSNCPDRQLFYCHNDSYPQSWSVPPRP